MMLSLEKMQFFATFDRFTIDSKVQQTHQRHGQIERGDGGRNRHWKNEELIEFDDQKVRLTCGFRSKWQSTFAFGQTFVEEWPRPNPLKTKIEQFDTDFSFETEIQIYGRPNQT